MMVPKAKLLMSSGDMEGKEAMIGADKSPGRAEDLGPRRGWIRITTTMCDFREGEAVGVSRQ